MDNIDRWQALTEYEEAVAENPDTLTDSTEEYRTKLDGKPPLEEWELDDYFSRTED